MTTELIDPAAPVSKDKIVNLRLDAIRLDGGTQSRAKGVNTDTVKSYADALRNGSKFPAIVVFHGVDDRAGQSYSNGDPEKKHYWLASGFHRYYAMQQVGILAEFVKVIEGSRRDAILYSVGSNEKHGLQRTNDDKRFAVRLLLSDPDWWAAAHNWIAEKCRVSRDLVQRIYDEMTAENTLAEGGELDLVPCDGEDEGGADEAGGEADQSAVSAHCGNEDSGQCADTALCDDAEKEVPAKATRKRRRGSNRGGGTEEVSVPDEKKRAPKVKPVRRIDPEDSKAIAKKYAQEVRSWPKAIRQSHEMGRTIAQMIEKCVKTAYAIPVADDDGEPVEIERKMYLVDRDGNVSEYDGAA